MSQRVGHEALGRAAQRWLVAIADPEAAPGLPAQPLSETDLALLIEAAAAHGVLPAALRSLRRAGDAAGTLLAAANARGVALAGANLLLMHHAGSIAAALAPRRLDWTFVKGPVFARRIYPHAGDRTFTDLDILADAAHAGAVGEALRGLGFTLASAAGGAELKWTRDRPSPVLVEVQTDLVHSSRLGRGVSLRFEDVVAMGGGESAESLLLVAAVHGAAGHQFERLQQVVDVAQAVRRGRGLDLTRLESGLERTGAGLALRAALDLAARCFGDPAVEALARRLSGGGRRWIARRLLSPGAAARAQSVAGLGESWRRRAFRELLKHARTRGR